MIVKHSFANKVSTPENEKQPIVKNVTGSRRNALRERFGGFFVSKSVFVTIFPTLVT
jgi:hypothetical protein